MTHLKTLLALALIAFGCACTTSCATPPKLPDAEEIAAVKSDVAKAQAEVTKLAEQVEAAKAKALKTAKDTIAKVSAARQAAIAFGVVPKELEEQTGQALGYAEGVLGRYERGEPVTKAELLSALDAVGSVIRELRKLGRELEPLVDSSLDLVRTAIEGSS